MTEKNKQLTLKTFELVIQHMNMLAHQLNAPFRAKLVKKEDIKNYWWNFNE